MDNSKAKIRTRFAPSPTGFVHIGSLRTALFSFLFARHNGGVHVLRIEDTDQNRAVEGALENLLKVMKITGVEFDEGFYLKDDGSIGERGEFGPYLQSKRLELYQKYAEQLVTEGKAYYCFCTEQRLEDLRKEQTALKKPPMYDRHCYNLSAEEKEKQMAELTATGKKPVVRFLIPEGRTVIHDLIYGDITYEHKVLDDQVILKSDGFPTYHLAVVVDDHFMEISHVIRGEEWIPSTPKHILIYQALGWQPVKFAHLPLILNPDKSKLSKRQGDVSVEDFLAKGYLPEALLNFVAFLGWNPKTEQEIFSLQQLVKEFNLENVHKAGAVFDINKLDWLNGLYIKLKSNTELANLLKPYLTKAGVNVDDFSKEYLEAIAAQEKERLKKLSEIGEGRGYYFKQPEYQASLLVWKKSDKADAKQKLSELLELFSGLDENNFDKENLETEIKNFISEKLYDNGSVLWPLRVALTGQEKSPGPFETASLLYLGLGKDEILARIQAAINKLE
jgi:glutamyl-tRNA synthetase